MACNDGTSFLVLQFHVSESEEWRRNKRRRGDARTAGLKPIMAGETKHTKECLAAHCSLYNTIQGRPSSRHEAHHSSTCDGLHCRSAQCPRQRPSQIASDRRHQEGHQLPGQVTVGRQACHVSRATPASTNCEDTHHRSDNNTRITTGTTPGSSGRVTSLIRAWIVVHHL